MVTLKRWSSANNKSIHQPKLRHHGAYKHTVTINKSMFGVSGDIIKYLPYERVDIKYTDDFKTIVLYPSKRGKYKIHKVTSRTSFRIMAVDFLKEARLFGVQYGNYKPKILPDGGLLIAPTVEKNCLTNYL